MRLVFMGTPAFALPTLKALHEAGHEIVAVYTQPPRPAGRGQKDTPSPVHAFALEKGFQVFTPVSLKDTAVQKTFADHKAEVAIVAAYGLLLPKPILGAYKLGCMNVHPSLLPRWRGAAPIQRCIMAGDSETGVCIMQMDEGLDTGDVLMENLYEIPIGINASDLEQTLSHMGAELMVETLELMYKGLYQRRPQSKTGVTYAAKISKEEYRIDWDKPAETVYQQILGLSEKPGAYFTFNGERIKILKADLYSDNMKDSANPGLVIDGYLTIGCKQGAIRPVLLQRSGKDRAYVEEFLRGFIIPKGSMLE